MTAAFLRTTATLSYNFNSKSGRKPMHYKIPFQTPNIAEPTVLIQTHELRETLDFI
jgi:hypothetical protein